MTQQKEPVSLDEIQRRLACIYAAVKQAAPVDLKPSDIKQKIVTGPDGRFRVWFADFSFDRSDVNRRAKLISFRRPTLTRVGRLFEASSASDFI